MDIQSLIAPSTGQQTTAPTPAESEPITNPLINETTDVTTDTSEPTDDSLQSVSENSAAETAEQFTTFLTLLTAQIQNQDPLAPLDSTQFVEQLATFSNLEIQAEGNAVLEDIAQLIAESTFTTIEPSAEPS